MLHFHTKVLTALPGILYSVVKAVPGFLQAQTVCIIAASTCPQVESLTLNKKLKVLGRLHKRNDFGVYLNFTANFMYVTMMKCPKQVCHILQLLMEEHTCHPRGKFWVATKDGQIVKY
eukprot:3679267-Amphidinium_carterae.1